MYVFVVVCLVCCIDSIIEVYVCLLSHRQDLPGGAATASTNIAADVLLGVKRAYELSDQFVTLGRISVVDRSWDYVVDG